MAFARDIDMRYAIYRQSINIFRILLLVVVCLLMAGIQFIPAGASTSNESAELPEIASFTVSPANIGSGSSATLTWSVSNAASVDIDHGIGSVGEQGQIQVNPAYTTTYKITAMNNAGVRSRSITLDVSYNQPVTDSGMVNCDPVTGRNASIDMAWEQLCLSSKYQVQIARDPGFTLKVYDSGIMDPADVTAPAFWYPPGNLEAGHTYYWRVRTRQAATGQYLVSPWSDPQSFTVRPGYAVRADSYGMQALTPVNGSTGWPVSPASFSWSGYPDISKYRFILAQDPQLQNIVVEEFTSTTSYGLKGSLDYETAYYWQVTAVEPVPSDPSAVFIFQTTEAPEVVVFASGSDASSIPPWALAVIIAGILLISITLFLIIRVKRAI